jgi:hypothetical protein
MKKIIALILILILLFTQTVYAEIYYNDIFTHWSRNDVNYATNALGLFKGYSDMSFKPDANISRSEFITILVRAGYKLGVIEEIYDSPMNYDDMTIDHWSYTFVISFYEYMGRNFKNYRFEDIFKGSNFQPNKAITREEAIALTAVLCRSSIYDNDIQFSDIDKSYRFYNEVKTLSNSGIVTGYENNLLRPFSNISRAESASLIRRIFDNIKASFGNNLTSLKYMPVRGEDILSLFGNYSVTTKDEKERKYLKAKKTLEQIEFSGYIFPEEKHLYDSDPIGTLKALRASGFSNKSGLGFYLIKYGKLSERENTALANEILQDLINRKDLNDADKMQLFNQINKFNTTETLYMDALKKWYDNTANDNAKYNIKTFRYSYYIKTGKINIVRAMIHEDLKAGTDFSKILSVTWNIDETQSLDFYDMLQVKMYFNVYRALDYISSTYNPNNAKVSILENIVIVDTNEAVDLSLIKSEDLYYKYSLNKAYILKYVGENERAFVEMMNDYKIIKSMNIYKAKKLDVDNNYNSILKYFKR